MQAIEVGAVGGELAPPIFNLDVRAKRFGPLCEHLPALRNASIECIHFFGHGGQSIGPSGTAAINNLARGIGRGSADGCGYIFTRQTLQEDM